MYNYERKCQEVANKFNLILDTPITVNNRLSTTLGRVIFVRGTCEPIAIEFSPLIFKHSDEEVEQIILHEMAHWLILKIEKKNHGHDEVFKRYCKMIGCIDNTASTKEVFERPGDLKYDLICEKCGFIGGRSRTIKRIYEYHCAKCGGALRLKQNW